MRSRVRLFGHSLHQMLIVFPLGLLATGVLFDIIYLARHDEIMAAVSYWMIAAGIIGGLLAAPFGFLDWLAIPSGTRAKRIGAMHGGGNLIVVLLFIASWWMRDTNYSPTTAVMVWSFAGAILALFTGWLGGELVDRLGVGVDEDANLDATNSLHAHHEARHAHVIGK
ncbi:MAG TPA: DUF2231 domain-containing protein [Ramlibacter sp.]|nr:DUF2231 domain-containing protein [Ramlibacter sp.]